MKKRKILILGSIVSILLLQTSCASIIDLVVPTVIPYGVEEYLGHEVPNYKGVTTLMVLKAVKEEIKWKHALDNTKYAIATSSTEVTIQGTESMRDGMLAGAAALGLGGVPLSYLVGKKKKRPEDYTKEEYEVAGSMQPEEFKTKV